MDRFREIRGDEYLKTVGTQTLRDQGAKTCFCSNNKKRYIHTNKSLSRRGHGSKHHKIEKSYQFSDKSCRTILILGPFCAIYYYVLRPEANLEIDSFMISMLKFTD